MKPGKITTADFPAHHPEWVHRDHMLIGWGMVHGLMMAVKLEASDKRLCIGFAHDGFEWIEVDADPYGLPILTPELRQSLGAEWRKWKDSQP